MNQGTLYIVATPIGNLKDITLRALEVLKDVDLVLCEDTRVTGNLLHHLDIKKPLKSLHQHSSDQITGEVIDLLKSGQNIAYITDGGTPGISDPGTALVKAVQGTLTKIQSPNNIQIPITKFKQKNIPYDAKKGGNDTKEFDNGSNLKANSYQLKPSVVPVPGSSAVTAAVSVSGLVEKEFYFAGFLPKKKGRQTEFKYLATIKAPVIIYESAQRLERTLIDIKTFFGQNTEVFIAREMTKMFEEYFGGNVNFVLSDLKNHTLKGEIVLIVKKLNS